MKNILNGSALEGIGQKVSTAAQSGVARSRQMAEIAKLRMNNVSEEDAMKRAFIEIGKLYYAEHGDAPDGAYTALCSRISKAQDNIDANLAQIAALKQNSGADDAEDAVIPDDLPGNASEELEVEPDSVFEEFSVSADAAEADESIPDEE